MIGLSERRPVHIQRDPENSGIGIRHQSNLQMYLYDVLLVLLVAVKLTYEVPHYKISCLLDHS